jgi:hypothetical protein
MVSSGDTCTSIASSYGITVADIESLNLDVGSSCTSIWRVLYLHRCFVGRNLLSTSLQVRVRA